MIQQPAYALGSRYIRIRETGSVFPVHPEQLKMVKKDLADLVEWNGTHFVRVELGSLPKTEPVKIVSTPARKPEPQTPPPQVQRTFEAPGTGPTVEAFEAPPAANIATPEEALAAAAAAVPAPNAAPAPVTKPATQAPPVVKKTIITQPPRAVDLTVEAPPE